MRLFVAIPLEEKIKEEIFKYEEILKEKTRAKIKWVEKENIHITLKFLGEVKDSKLKEIRKSLASVMLGFMPFDITFMDVGYFPFEKNPRVLWVGADSLEIIKLAKKIDESMNIIGFEREKREFQSHITIARIKEGYYDINTIEKDIYFGKMTINKIGLYQSHLSSKGPTYQIINTFLAQ